MSTWVFFSVDIEDIHQPADSSANLQSLVPLACPTIYFVVDPYDGNIDCASSLIPLIWLRLNEKNRTNKYSQYAQQRQHHCCKHLQPFAQSHCSTKLTISQLRTPELSFWHLHSNPTIFFSIGMPLFFPSHKPTRCYRWLSKTNARFHYYTMYYALSLCLLPQLSRGDRHPTSTLQIKPAVDCRFSSRVAFWFGVRLASVFAVISAWGKPCGHHSALFRDQLWKWRIAIDWTNRGSLSRKGRRESVEEPKSLHHDMVCKHLGFIKINNQER